MSEKLTIYEKSGNPIYHIIIEKDFSRLGEFISALGTENRKVCIVTESNVDPLYGSQVLEIAGTVAKEAYKFVFSAGEANKNLYTVKDLYTFLIENHFERKDLLVALGGGVVGDLTGYTAATYLRGIDFVQIPTTLVAQSDSSVGGKTGVDFDGYKNMVGAFWQPKLVYMNTSTLKSLPEKEFLSGMGEVVKHGLIRDAKFYQWLKENADSILNRDSDTLEYLAKVNCSIKKAVVENDFMEQGERAILNFGHTLGHAIEKYVYQFHLHGECVSIGMNGAAFISYQKGFISKDDYRDILDTLKLFKLPITENRIDIDNILAATISDKKMDGGKVNFIILKGIGNAVISREIDMIDMRNGLYAILGD